VHKRVHFSIVVILAAGAFALLTQFGIAATKVTGGTWLDFAFTAEQTRLLIEGYDRHDILAHRWMTTHTDLMLPIILAAFAIALFYHALPEKPRNLLVALAVWGSVADYAENMVIVSLLDGGTAYGLKAILTSAKFLLNAVPLGFAVYLFLLEAKSRLLAKPSPRPR
jgi:hypothetical protein